MKSTLNLFFAILALCCNVYGQDTIKTDSIAIKLNCKKRIFKTNCMPLISSNIPQRTYEIIDDTLVVIYSKTTDTLVQRKDTIFYSDYLYYTKSIIQELMIPSTDFKLVNVVVIEINKKRYIFINKTCFKKITLSLN